MKNEEKAQKKPQKATEQATNPMKIEMIELSALKPYENNPRINDEASVELQKSIKTFGFRIPMVITAENVIVCGHTRYKAAKALGMAEVPCIRCEGMTEEQIRAFRIADNKYGELSHWDTSLLASELVALRDLDFGLDTLGFSDTELTDLLNIALDIPEDSANDDEDTEVAIPEDDPVTAPGDIWLLGNHRLICGDSTRADIVERLFAGAKPNLMVTDPPYGVNYDPTRLNCPERSGLVQNDDRDDWQDAYALFPGNVAYVWHASLHSEVVMQNLKNCGFTISSVIIWNKSQFVMGRADYHWKHEPCIYATRGAHNWKGGRDKCTVWDIGVIRNLKEGEWGHGTQKPIECMRRPIENNSDRGDWVYDPFCGSGTTIIAAERTGRRGLGIELDPRYCDAIVRRWEAETGKDAIREADGVRFKDLRSE